MTFEKLKRVKVERRLLSKKSNKSTKLISPHIASSFIYQLLLKNEIPWPGRLIYELKKILS